MVEVIVQDGASQCQLDGGVTGTGSKGYGLFVILLTALACGCAARGATPSPFPTVTSAKSKPRPVPAADPAAAEGAEAATPGAVGTGGSIALGSAAVQAALQMLGKPYAPGGSGPDRFDCSGLVQYAYSRIGFSVPRTVSEQFQATEPIAKSAVAAGDLLFFRISGSGPSHVAIALGDGTFVHAPNRRGEVRVEALDAEYWDARFVGAHRVRMKDAEGTERN
jgi:cell wall-associated NlpC family hydrolase